MGFVKTCDAYAASPNGSAGRLPLTRAQPLKAKRTTPRAAPTGEMSGLGCQEIDRLQKQPRNEQPGDYRYVSKRAELSFTVSACEPLLVEPGGVKAQSRALECCCCIGSPIIYRAGYRDVWHWCFCWSVGE
jgi:hypothetical protein